MKNISSFLFAFLFAFVIYGQSTKTALYQSWISGTWVSSGQIIRTFDGNAYLTESLTQSWDNQSSGWKNVRRTTYTNNPDGTVHQQVLQNWNATDSSWTNSERLTMTYNSAAKLASSIKQNWTNGYFINSVKTVNTYDGNGYLINSLSLGWNSSLNNWRNMSQYNYTNDSNGYAIESLSQMWNSTDSYWYNSAVIFFDNTFDGRVLSRQTNLWQNGGWVNFTIYSCTYDVNNYLITLAQQNWDQTLSEWKDYSLTTYTNSSDGTLLEAVTQLWNSGSLNNYQRVVYSSSLGLTETAQATGISIFPNPAADQLRVSLGDASETKISISDLQGRLYFSEFFECKEAEINLTEFPANAYLITIQSRDKTLVSRFIKN